MRNTKMSVQALVCFVLVFSLMLPAAATEAALATTNVLDEQPISHSRIDSSPRTPSAMTLNTLQGPVTPMVAAGWFHTVGLKSDGTVVAVGSNDSGQCNVGSWDLTVSVPVGGTISTNTTWDLSHSPYIVTSDLTITSGATLTIDPGVTVQIAHNVRINVYGGLIAQGTPGNEITFTPYTDWWYGLLFYSGSTGDLDYCTIESGQNGYGVYVNNAVSVDMDNCTVESGTDGYGVYIRDTEGVDLDNCTMQNNYYGGLYCKNVNTATPNFTNNTFQNNGYGITFDNCVSPSIDPSNIIQSNSYGGVHYANCSSLGTIDNLTVTGNGQYGAFYISSSGTFVLGPGNTITGNAWPLTISGDSHPDPSSTIPTTGNTNNNIRVHGGSIDAPRVWTLFPGLDYVITDHLTIASGATLTIDPGVTVQIAHNVRINVYGGLIAQGTPGNEITFTPYTDWWYGLLFYSGSTGDLDYCTIESGQNGYGVYVNNAVSVDMDNCILRNNNYGIYAQSMISDNVLISNSNIENNSQYGVYNAGTIVISAENNWWGDASGPYHPSTNSSGSGDKVSDYVDFEPWLFAPKDTTDAEIDVLGHGTSIADGDVTPSVEDDTDFGSAEISTETVECVFTIRNNGVADLNLIGDPIVAINGTHAADFSVTVQPITPVAQGGGMTNFTIRFDPSGIGLREANVSIANDDADEDPYDFAIQGFGVDTVPPEAPSGLQSEFVPQNKVRLLWQLSTSDDVAHYNVYFDSGTGTMDYATPLAIVNHPESEWFWEYTQDGIYHFVVRAVDTSDNEEKNTETLEITITQAPPLPVSDLHADVLTDSRIRLTWTPSISEDAAEYRVYWDNGTGVMNYAVPLAVLDHPDSEYETSELADGTYFFAIRTEDESGVEETNTDTVWARVDTIPPEEVTNFNYELLTGNMVRLSWSPSTSPDVEHYYLYSGNNTSVIDYINPTAVLESDDVSWTSGVINATNYAFAIVAVDTSGNSVEPVTTVLEVELLYPDLCVSSVTWDPQEFKYGDTIVFETQISNNGTTGNDGGFFVAYYCDDILIAIDYYADSIPLGEAVSISTGWWAGIVSKSYNLTVVADDLGDRIVESDENNNRSLPQIITVLPEYIVSPSTDYPAYIAGDTVVLSVMVADSSAWGSYLSDADVTVSYELLDAGNTTVVPPTQLSSNNSSGVNVFTGLIDTTGYDNDEYTFLLTATGIGGNKTATCQFYVVDDVQITVQTSKVEYYPGEPVVISGQVLSGNGSAINNTSVGITVQPRGFQQHFVVRTDQEGDYAYTYVPLQGQGGYFDVQAVTTANHLHRQADTEFSVEGLFVVPTAVNVDMCKNTVIQGTVNVINIGTQEIANLDFYIEDHNESDSVTASIASISLPGTIAPDEQVPVDIEVAGGIDAPDHAVFDFIASGDEIPEASINITVALHEPEPLPVIEPDQFRMGVHPGELVTREVTIRNAGYGYLRNIQVHETAFDWVTIIGAEVGTLAPSANSSFEVWINPAQDVSFGIYQTQITIDSDEGQFYVNVTIDVDSSQVGNLEFKVRDDTGANLPDATVTLISEEEYTLETVSGSRSYRRIVSQQTDSEGVADFSDVPEGDYDFQVDAVHHASATGEVCVMAGDGNDIVSVILVTQLVHVEWVVTPTEVPDRYTIELYLTFETDVPKPVLLLQPPLLQFSMRGQDEEVAGQLVVSNPSLVRISNVTIDATMIDGVDIRFPSPGSSDEWGDLTSSIEIGTLEPQGEPIVLPYQARLKEGSIDEIPTNLGTIVGEGEYVYYLQDGSDPEPRVGKTMAEILVKYHSIDEGGGSGDGGLRVVPDLIYLIKDLCKDEIMVGLPSQCKVVNGAVNCTHATVTNERDEGVSLERAFALTEQIAKLPLGPEGFCEAAITNALKKLNISTGGALWAGNFTKSYLFPGDSAQLTIDDVQIFDLFAWSDDTASLYQGDLHIPYYWDSDVVNNYTFIRTEKIMLTGAVIGCGCGSNTSMLVGGGGGGYSWGIWGGGGGGGSWVTPDWPDVSFEDPPDEPTVHEIVKLKISQEAALEREAFEASMQITPLVDDLEDVQVELIIKDDDGNIVNDLFQHAIRSFSGIESLDGDGTIATGDLGRIKWIIVPGATTGGTDLAGKDYYVGSKLYYAVGGQSHVYETEYEPILVKPQPSLIIDYYIPREVEADQAFKVEVEVHNEGPGIAHNFRIKSAQPQIIESENPSGLLIDFNILGSAVGEAYSVGDMQPDFGDILVDETVSGYWLMTSSLSGNFTAFNATMRHENYLGMELNPLIKEVNTHIIDPEYVEGPTADFSANVTSGDAPLSVQFTDQSTVGDNPINAWYWDFGDGDTSTTQNPSHTYYADGTYNVTLKVTDEHGCSDTEARENYITAGATAWANIDLTEQCVRTSCEVTATVTITENDVSGPAIVGARVYVDWSGDYRRTLAGTTNRYGQLSFTAYIRESDIVTFTVTKVVKDRQEYILSGETSDSTGEPADNPPAISIASPADGATVSGVVTIAADASDDGGVAQVDFYYGATLIGTDETAPYSVDWDSTLVGDGVCTLTCTAIDIASQEASASINVTVHNDNPPAVSITSPADGAIVSGVVTIAADASDDAGVAQVDFYYGATLIGTDSAAPYNVDWESTAVGDGVYALTCTAIDTASQEASDSINVTVDNVTYPPVVNAGPDQTVSDADGTGIETVILDGSGSYDPDGSISSYNWTEGGASLGTDETISCDFAVGTHNITLAVTDDRGASASDECMIDIVANQAPIADAGADQSAYVGDSVIFDGSGSSDSDGSIVSYDWDLGDEASGSGLTVSHAYAEAGTYNVTLTVTDNGGSLSEDTAVVTISEAPARPTAWVNIDLTEQCVRTSCEVTATVTITENDVSGPAIVGARVYVDWSGDYRRTLAGTTNRYGQLSFTAYIRESDIVTFTVTKVVKDRQEYILSGETSDSTG